MATMAADIEQIPVSAEVAWRAVTARDAAYDGRFVYAVKTTRIYCKPSCGSRRPLRGNVEFFARPGDAAAAGYRPCRRCKPALATVDSATNRGIALARAYLDANPDRRIPLSELAAHARLSPSHLQRSFRQIVGLSPRAYQQARQVNRFKSRLRAGDTVSRATYEAGFGSSSRVYEKSDELLGMTPAAYRRGGAGVRIAYTITDSPVGRVLIATTDRGVCAVEIGSTDSDVEAALRRDFPNAAIDRNDDVHRAWVRAVLDCIRHPSTNSRRIPLDVEGTPFQMKVWAALQEIPAGERRTYSDLAASIGQPTAARAVARACATNRLAVVIPCHRVVRGDGALAGYKWGVDRKARLLDDEGTG